VLHRSSALGGAHLAVHQRWMSLWAWQADSAPGRPCGPGSFMLPRSFMLHGVVHQGAAASASASLALRSNALCATCKAPPNFACSAFFAVPFSCRPDRPRVKPAKTCSRPGTQADCSLLAFANRKGYAGNKARMEPRKTLNTQKNAEHANGYREDGVNLLSERIIDCALTVLHALGTGLRKSVRTFVARAPPPSPALVRPDTPSQDDLRAAGRFAYSGASVLPRRPCLIRPRRVFSSSRRSFDP
jgi:hypothetical protein